jgi:ankyrin repeat protein
MSISDETFQKRAFGGGRVPLLVNVDDDDNGFILENTPSFRDLALKDFLLNYRFNDATDYGPNGLGLPPLLCAAFEGSTTVVCALLEARSDPNRAYRGSVICPHIGLLPGGILPLHTAVGARASQTTMRALLSHGADPNATIAHLGFTPLIGGVYADSADGIRSLHSACIELNMCLELEKGIKSVGISPLGLAAYAADPKTVQALVDIGCDRGAVSDAGSTVFRCACENPRMDFETLELLWQQGDGVDVNETAQPRTQFWQALMSMSEQALKLPIVGGWARTFGDYRGSTPLHAAARLGRLNIVKWLVTHGAVHSLQARTVSGATPVELASRGGHYAVVGFLNRAIAEQGQGGQGEPEQTLEGELAA